MSPIFRQIEATMDTTRPNHDGFNKIVESYKKNKTPITMEFWNQLAKDHHIDPPPPFPESTPTSSAWDMNGRGWTPPGGGV